MAFNIGLSGLRASQVDLDVTGLGERGDGHHEEADDEGDADHDASEGEVLIDGVPVDRLSRAELDEVVATSPKQRFALSDDGRRHLQR